MPKVNYNLKNYYAMEMHKVNYNLEHLWLIVLNGLGPIWYMCLKTKNCCLKICVEICVEEKMCENACNVV